MDIVKSYFLVVTIFGISDWDSLCTPCLGTFSFRFFIEEIPACGRRLGGLASSGSDDGYRSSPFQ